MPNYLPIVTRRAKALLSLFVLLSLALIVRAAILTIGPANRLQANLAVMNRTPTSFVALGQQVELLDKITSDIDSYNLAQIKSALTTTARLAANARTEFQAQYDAWISIKGEAAKDNDSFLQLRRRLDDVQNLQDAQIIHLKKLLEESTKATPFEGAINLLISFVFGVLSSLLSSHVYDRWKAKQLRA